MTKADVGNERVVDELLLLGLLAALLLAVLVRIVLHLEIGSHHQVGLRLHDTSVLICRVSHRHVRIAARLLDL